MNLKDLLISKDTPPELYWSLVIEKGLVQSGIWYIGEGKVEVVGIGSGIPWETDEELVEAVDSALSSAIQKLPENYPEPQKTVFGVSTSWVENGEISSENLSKIKKICTDLSLTPVGFVVLPEAIAHLYKSEEGSPLNAIVLKADSDLLELSLFKLGNLSGTTEVQRSVSLVDDVIEGLSRFEGANPLPTRFVVYDGKEGELEEIKQTLIQADWTVGKISFLHTPQVETLSVDKKVMAVALAGGAEIGNVTSVVTSEESEEEKAEEPETNEEPKTEEDSLKDFGFTVGEDVSNVVPVESNIPEVVPHQVQEQIPTPNPVLPKKTAGEFLARGKSLFHSFSTRIFPSKIKIQGNSNKKFIAAGIAVGAVLIFVLILWAFFQTANINIYVTPKRAEQSFQVTFDKGGTFDVAARTIPASVITDEVTGEKTKSTTGTKLIGNKATGSVQIANGNSASINLATGTTIISSSGFKFTIDNQASVSGQIIPGSPGTSNVNVTSYDIGAQYNLAKGEIFSVGNYSKALVAATSTNDFTGGSSQQISAVGKDDQASLEKELKDELSQSVKTNLSAKIDADKILIGDLANLEIVSETFDHKVGEQADNLKLSLKINATALAGDREKLIEYAKNVLGGKTPSGYTLASDQIDFRFTFVSEKDGKYTYDVVIGGNFLPAVDTTKIKKTISGKTVSATQTYLDKVPGFDHADIGLKIKFPGILKTIPRISKNIIIEIRPE